MKLFNSTLEKIVIKLLCTVESNLAFYALSKLTIQDFSQISTQECFRRIKTILKSQNEIPTFLELVNDPAISESTRDLFVSFTKTKKVTKTTSMDRLLSQLGDYRKARELFTLAQNTIKTLHDEPKLDLDKLIVTINDGLIKARMNKEDGVELVHIGEGNNSAALVKALLTNNTALRGIPTGFKVWDDINSVVPFGSCFIVAATTSGLKTTLALQLCRNFVEQGARCAYVSLEMTKDEIMQRRLSNLSRVSMTKITNPARMTNSEKKKVADAYTAYSDRNKKKKAVETFFHPKGEITDDEVIFKISSLNYLSLIHI